MAGKRVLYVVHGHPASRPGGAEAYALELYGSMRDLSTRFEPFLMARSGPPLAPPAAPEGALRSPFRNDPNQLLFETDGTDYDWFYGKLPNKAVLTKYYRDALLALEPDVVHFQHTLFLGYDMIRATRRVLPDVPIVYTLHEYLPICHRNGQMIRTRNDELCSEASPRRCHGCFPEIAPSDFYLREQFVKAQFECVDMFVAPSRFLMERYVHWGLEPERIIRESNGRRLPAAVTEPARRGPRARLGFFGQFTHFKGVDVLLQAMARLHSEGSSAHLSLHGSNLDMQPEEFRSAFSRLLDEAGGAVTMAGRYERDELPRLMAEVDWVVVPSRWWENSPLTIQEAFAYGRPVITSDIGGMAEMVVHGVNGLTSRAGDPLRLAETIQAAVAEEGLWEKLRGGIKPIQTMDAHVRRLEDVYSDLIEQAQSRPQLGDVLEVGPELAS